MAGPAPAEEVPPAHRRRPLPAPGLEPAHLAEEPAEQHRAEVLELAERPVVSQRASSPASGSPRRLGPPGCVRGARSARPRRSRPTLRTRHHLSLVARCLRRYLCTWPTPCGGRNWPEGLTGHEVPALEPPELRARASEVLPTHPTRRPARTVRATAHGRRHRRGHPGLRALRRRRRGTDVRRPDLAALRSTRLGRGRGQQAHRVPPHRDEVAAALGWRTAPLSPPDREATAGRDAVATR